MTFGRRIHLKGLKLSKSGKVEKKPNYASRNRASKRARAARKMLRGKPLL